MTDKEIIKALECCKQATAVGCKNCPLYEDKGQTCITILSHNALDLIKRQNAEIERLQKENTVMRIQARKNRNKRDKSSKAIRKFKKRLKSYVLGIDRYRWAEPLTQDDWFEIKIRTFFRAIDDIAKEMAGDN